jgi:hypothetical protein
VRRRMVTQFRPQGQSSQEMPTHRNSTFCGIRSCWQGRGQCRSVQPTIAPLRDARAHGPRTKTTPPPSPPSPRPLPQWPTGGRRGPPAARTAARTVACPRSLTTANGAPAVPVGRRRQKPPQSSASPRSRRTTSGWWPSGRAGARRRRSAAAARRPRRRRPRPPGEAPRLGVPAAHRRLRFLLRAVPSCWPAS